MGERCRGSRVISTSVSHASKIRTRSNFGVLREVRRRNSIFITRRNFPLATPSSIRIMRKTIEFAGAKIPDRTRIFHQSPPSATPPADRSQLRYVFQSKIRKLGFCSNYGLPLQRRNAGVRGTRGVGTMRVGRFINNTSVPIDFPYFSGDAFPAIH